MKSRKIRMIIASIIVLVLLIATIGVVAVSLLGDSGVSLKAVDISNRMHKAIADKEYCNLTLDVSDTDSSMETANVYEYQVSVKKGSSERAYLFIADGADLREYWEATEDQDGNRIYDVWIYDIVTENWVYSPLDSEPVTVDIWDNFLPNLDKFTLLDKTDTWQDTGIECYVFETLSDNTEYANIYEQVWVDTKTYLPVAIVAYGQQEDSSLPDVSSEEQITMADGSTADKETVSAGYKETTEVYTFEFSDENNFIFGKPEQFLTTEEYTKIMQDLQKDEDTAEDEIVEED